MVKYGSMFFKEDMFFITDLIKRIDNIRIMPVVKMIKAMAAPYTSTLYAYRRNRHIQPCQLSWLKGGICLRRKLDGSTSL